MATINIILSTCLICSVIVNVFAFRNILQLRAIITKVVSECYVKARVIENLYKSKSKLHKQL